MRSSAPCYRARSQAGSPASAPTAAPPATKAGAAAAFPVNIEHKYGSTRINQAPQRVVTVGFNDHDFVLALGMKPVAVRDWFGKQPFATWPWAQDELGDAQPQVLPSGELTLLSLPFALEQLVPQLAAAVDGNPATEPTPGS